MSKKEAFLKFLNDRIHMAFKEPYESIVIKTRIKSGNKEYDEVVFIPQGAWRVRHEEVEKLYDNNLVLRSLYGFTKIIQYYACVSADVKGIGHCVILEG